LFLEECARALAETGMVGDGGRSAEPLTELQGLATVQAVLAARMRRLEPDDQQLVETAAGIRATRSVTVPEPVSGLTPDRLARTLPRLEAAELLHQSGPFAGVEVTFTQPLMHEVVYGGLSPARRRALHARTLQAIERLGPEHPAAQADVLGEHAFRGEAWDR